MNAPNLISLLRILLVPVFTTLYMRGNIPAAAGVLLLCGVSDVLDGAIARRYGLVTDLGKALDPIADKLIQAAMMLCAAMKAPCVLLLLSLHVLRELALAALGLYVMRATGRVYSARWYGKLCTFAIYAFLLALLVLPEPSSAFVAAGVAVCSVLVVFCLALYSANYFRVLREARGPGGERKLP